MKVYHASKGLINYRGKVLIIQESSDYKDGTNKDNYVFPGGRIKGDETFVSCLEREVLEETGLKIKVGNPFIIQESNLILDNKKYKIKRIFFRCFSNSNKIRLNSEHKNYKWINPKDFKKYKIAENMKEVFLEYLKLK